MSSNASASPHHAAMFAHAHVFVRLHSRLQDNNHLAVMTVDPSGDAILMTVMSRDCRTYEARLEANDMKDLKDTVHSTVEVSWGAFFDLIQRCFVERNMEVVPTSSILKLTLKHDRQTDLLPTAAFTATISIQLQLASPQDGAIAKTVASMVAFLSLRSGDRREAERIEEICRQDEQLREDAALVTAEAATLREEVRQFRSQTEAAESQVAELQTLLSSSNGVVGWADVLARADLSKVSSRVPPTWVARPLIRHNVRLLKSVKVKWPFTVMITKGLPSANTTAGSPELEKGSPNQEDPQDLNISTRTGPIRGEHLRYCNVVSADADSSLPALSKEEDDVFLELGQMDDWSFSVPEFDSLCRKAAPKSVGALYYLGYAVFMRLGLCARFNIGEAALLEWLAAVEAAYRNVPFHNSLHAADTLHCVYFMLAQADIVKKAKFTDIQVLAAVIAAILVDFDHPGSGITNQYLRSTEPSYATLAYANQSVLESHHVAAGFELMKQPRFNLLECLSPENRAELQSLTSQLVLVTDLGRHDAVLSTCQRGAQAADFGSQKDDAMLLLGLVLKAADLGFAAKANNVYTFFVHRLIKELGSLAELEEKAGLPVTGISTVASSERKGAVQLNFLNFVVLPTFACLSDVVPKMRVTGEFIRSNKASWA